MAPSYEEQQPNYATELQRAVVVWNAPEGRLYAYPLNGGFHPLSEPLIRTDWQFLAVLPAGCRVTDIKQERGGLYRCSVGSETVYTIASVVMMMG